MPQIGVFLRHWQRLSGMLTHVHTLKHLSINDAWLPSHHRRFVQSYDRPSVRLSISLSVHLSFCMFVIPWDEKWSPYNMMLYVC